MRNMPRVNFQNNISIKRRMITWALALVILCCSMGGCSDNASANDVSAPDNSVISTSNLKSDADKVIDKEVVRQAIQEMIDGPSQNREEAIIPSNITKVQYRVDKDLVNVDFDPSIYDVDSYDKILVLANVTRRLCEIENVNYVSFTVDGAPLHDGRGIAYGVLDEDSFVENEGALINAYERAELHLYFAGEDGSQLIETRESLVYSSNISMDRLVVDKLIEGPLSSGAYPTINPNTVVNVVTTSDGVCYVDLSQEFLNKTTNITDDVMIYSIVNSLTNLTGINKVRILIDGKSDLPLVADLYERNLELVK